MRQPMRWNACATAGPMVPKPTTPTSRPSNPGEIVGQHAGAEIRVVALADLGVGPGEAPQQHRGRGHGIFGDRTVAAAGHIGDRNAEPCQRGLVEPVDARAGDLDELERGVLEQGGASFGPTAGMTRRGRRLHALRQRRIVGLRDSSPGATPAAAHRRARNRLPAAGKERLTVMRYLKNSGIPRCPR